MRKPRLSPEDQERVDHFVREGVNSVERQPFRGWTLLGIILVVLTILSGISLVLARLEGVL